MVQIVPVLLLGHRSPRSLHFLATHLTHSYCSNRRIPSGSNLRLFWNVARGIYNPNLVRFQLHSFLSPYTLQKCYLHFPAMAIWISPCDPFGMDVLLSYKCLPVGLHVILHSKRVKFTSSSNYMCFVSHKFVYIPRSTFTSCYLPPGVMSKKLITFLHTLHCFLSMRP